MSEQRRTRRIKVSVATILESESLHFFAETGDLSETGILLHTQRAFPIGTNLRVAFGLAPDLPNIIAEGVVRWAERDKGIGVEFTSLSPDNKQMLAQFLTTPGSETPAE